MPAWREDTLDVELTMDTSSPLLVAAIERACSSAGIALVRTDVEFGDPTRSERRG